MRTIDAVLKSACQTGQGVAIASAVVVSLAGVPLDDQSFEVLQYAKSGRQMAAVLRGDEAPNYGLLKISRGYQVAGVEYVEQLPPHHIGKVVETEAGDYEVTCETSPSHSMRNDDESPYAQNVKSFITGVAANLNITISVPEFGEANSIFGRTAYFPAQAFSNTNQALYGVGIWPYARIYETEDGLKIFVNVLDDPNVTDISILSSRVIRYYDWPNINFFYNGTVQGVANDYWLAYPNFSTQFAPDRYPSQYQTIYLNVDTISPSLVTMIEKYYNERDYARSMYLLADVSLEDGDVFQYDGYYWRIETISETFKSGRFDQTLFCLRVGDYLFLEDGASYLLLENGDKIIME